jgi:DNA-binding transcriptional MerR regulator
MQDGVLISEAARRLSVSSQYLRFLEWEGMIPPARRTFGYLVYSEGDIVRLKAMGIGSRLRRLKSTEEVLEAA